MTDDSPSLFEDTQHGVRFRIKVRAKARKEGVAGVIGSAVKVHVTAPALEGRANLAVIALLAKQLKLPKGSVKITAGERSANKTIVVAGLTAIDVRARIGIEGPLFKK